MRCHLSCSCTSYGFWRWTIAASVSHLHLSQFSPSFSSVDNSSSKSQWTKPVVCLSIVYLCCLLLSAKLVTAVGRAPTQLIIHDFVLYSPLKCTVFNFPSSLKVLAWNRDIHFIVNSYECVELLMKQNIIFVFVFFALKLLVTKHDIAPSLPLVQFLCIWCSILDILLIVFVFSVIVMVWKSYYIQGVNEYVLQCSVVDRWVQSGHILLIHPCPEMLYLHTRGSEMWRRTPVGKQPIELLE
jgi:hypothetical protein